MVWRASDVACDTCLLTYLLLAPRQDEALDSTVPPDPNAPYDMRQLVRRVLDERELP